MRRTVQLSAKNAYTATSKIIGPRYVSWRRWTETVSLGQSPRQLTEQKKMSHLFTVTPSLVGRISLCQCYDKYRDQICFKPDTGAQANVIPSSLYARLTKKQPLRPSTNKLFGYSGKQLTVKGSITLDCSYKGHTYTATFHIMDAALDSQPILGLQASCNTRSSDDPVCWLQHPDDQRQHPQGLQSVVYRPWGTGGWGNHLPQGRGSAHCPPCTLCTTHHQKQAKEGIGQEGRNAVMEKVTIPTDWVTPW